MGWGNSCANHTRPGASKFFFFSMVMDSDDRILEKKCSGKSLTGWQAVFHSFSSSTKIMDYIIVGFNTDSTLEFYGKKDHAKCYVTFPTVFTVGICSFWYSPSLLSTLACTIRYMYVPAPKSYVYTTCTCIESEGEGWTYIVHCSILYIVVELGNISILS